MSEECLRLSLGNPHHEKIKCDLRNRHKILAARRIEEGEEPGMVLDIQDSVQVEI